MIFTSLTVEGLIIAFDLLLAIRHGTWATFFSRLSLTGLYCKKLQYSLSFPLDRRFVAWVIDVGTIILNTGLNTPWSTWAIVVAIALASMLTRAHLVHMWRMVCCSLPFSC